MKLSDILKVDSIRAGLASAADGGEVKNKVQVIHEMIGILSGAFGLSVFP